MNHTTQMLVITGRRILLTIGLLFSSTVMQGSYTVGALDTTANGGTGYGNATPGSATGYVTAGFTDNMQLYGSAIQPDGKTVVVGANLTSGDAIIARYNINGTEDTTFNGFYVATKFGLTSALAKAVTVLPNGKIIVVGQAVNVSTKFFVAQFLPDGTLDTANFANPNGYVAQNVDTIGTISIDLANAVAVDASGNIYVAGTSNQGGDGNSPSIFVAKYNSAGVLQSGSYNPVPTVGGGGSAITQAGIALISMTAKNLSGNAIALDATDQVVVAGANLTDTSLFVARFTTGGILDTTFNTTGYNTLDLGGTADAAYAVGFQSTDKIIIAGTGGSFGPGNANVCVARFLIDGSLDAGPGGFGTGVTPIGYNNDRDVGGTPSLARSLAIQSDDTIVIGGTVTLTVGGTQNLLIARYLADGSALDITNFASPNGYTATYVASADNGNTLSMQQNGSFIVAGDYTTTNPNTNFITARYLGDQLVQGVMDYSYNPAVAVSPGTPGFSTYPDGLVATNTPKIQSLQATSGNNVVVASNYIVGVTNTALLKQISSTGATSGAGSASMAAPLSDYVINYLAIDNQNRILACQAGIAGIQLNRYTVSGTTIAADGTFTPVLSSDSSGTFIRVAEQTTGQLVCITNFGVNFGTLGFAANGGNNNAYLEIGGALGSDLLIDADDNSYIAYRPTASGNVKIVSYISSPTQAISGANTAFGAAGTLNTGLVYTSYGYPYIAFDNNSTVSMIMGIVNTTSDNFEFYRYGLTGGSSATASGTISSTLSNPVLTMVQCDTLNRPVFTGYDDNGFFVGRLVLSSTTYELDTTFAPYSATPGILFTKYNDNNPTTPGAATAPFSFSNCVGISPNGSIQFGGYEAIAYSGADLSQSISLVGQVVGDSSASQVKRYPGQIVDGLLDTSYGTSGAKDLTTDLLLPAGQAKAINVITTGAQAGKMLVADSNGTTTTIAMLNATGTALDANAFGTGVSSVTLSGMPQAAAIMVDPTGLTFYVLGTNGAVRGLTYGSATVTTFATSSLTAAYGITQQASGRILVSGLDSRGVIVAYTPAGVIDTSFNPLGLGGVPTAAGYWYTGVTSPITAISVATTATYADRIYLVYSDNTSSSLGNAVVQQLLENGTSYAPTSGTGAFTPITTGFSNTVNGNTQLRMQLDVNGKIVLSAATASTYGTTPAIKAARYTASGAVDVAALTVVSGTASQVIENILTLSDGTTLLLGAVPNATPASAFMNLARLTSAFALDSDFGSSGVLSTNVPSSSAVMSDFYALDVITAGGILVSGDNNPTAASAASYLAAVINTSVVTKVSQSATAFGAAGELDTTFNPAGTDAGFMNLRTEVTSGFPATTAVKVLFQLPNGTAYYVAGSTASDTYIMQMSDDDVQVAGWASGLLTISGKAAVSGILYAQNGGLVIVGGAGSSGSNAGWAAQYSAADGALYTDFVPTVFLDAYYSVAQQSNGRILVAGINDGVGAIIAYNPITGAVDTTFGVNGIYTATGYGAINSILVNASDNIYFVANEIAGLDRGFIIGVNASGTATIFSPNIVVTDSTVSANNHLAFNQAGNLTTVGVDIAALAIIIKTCSSVNGSVQSTYTFTSVVSGITTPHVTDILVDLNTTPGKVIVTGYDSSTSPNTPFVLRMQAVVASGLDTTFNADGGNPGVQQYNIVTGGLTTQWYTAMINANGKITVGGYASALTTPYVMRVYGDEFIGQYLPAVSAGAPGTINTDFATSGYLSLIGTATATAVPQVILPATSGGAQYVLFTDGSSATSTIARYTNANVLDSSYGTAGIAANSAANAYSMSFLANGGLLLAGTASTGNGWVEQYTSAGVLDTTFNPSGSIVTPYGSATPGILAIPSALLATVAVQQSSSRIVVAGRLGSGGNGALFGITNTGAVDATFGTAGIYNTGVGATVYTMVADEYDRLIIAYQNGSAVDLRRLTSSGELDTTFGTGGTIAGAITGTVDQAIQIRVALDAAGNIVVAAHIDTPAIAIRAYANTTGTSPVYAQLSLPLLETPVLTGLIATADGNVLVSGNSTTDPYRMWVARITSGGVLDTTTFATADAIPGIMQFAPGVAATPTARSLNSIAIYGDGEISMVGTETSSSGTANNPFMSRAYNTPYTSQEPIDLMASAPGTVDLTLGAGVSPNYAANGITFFASTDGLVQYAKAVVMQDGNDNGVLVAFDGTSTSITNSAIYLNMFDVDGLLNTSFKPSTVANTAPGQLLVLSMFENQYVNDMLTFTVGGVSKAILAGYATNSTPSATGSLLMQCVLTASAPGLDPDFGGLNNNSLGVAFGDGQSLNTVGLQSNGRIIAGGLDQSDNGLLLGYTPAGNLDQSFGQGGTFVQGTTGVYTSVIDTQDRLVIAYGDSASAPITLTLARILADGSGLDTSFGLAGTGIVTTTISTVLNNSNVRLALDGSGNIVVAAVVTDTASGTCFKIARYTSAGVLSGTVNLIGTGGSAMGLTAFTITKMLVDADGAVVVVGYDNAVSDQVVVARLVYSSTQYILDTTFNPTQSIPGYIKYQVDSAGNQQTFGAFIHPDGRIIIGGAQHA